LINIRKPIVIGKYNVKVIGTIENGRVVAEVLRSERDPSVSNDLVLIDPANGYITTPNRFANFRLTGLRAENKVEKSELEGFVAGSAVCVKVQLEDGVPVSVALA